MFKLYFKNGDGVDNFVTDLEKFSDFFEIVEKDIHARNSKYQIPYYRTYIIDNVMYIDVGSWSEEYLLKSDKPDMKESWDNYLAGGEK